MLNRIMIMLVSALCITPVGYTAEQNNLAVFTECVKQLKDQNPESDAPNKTAIKAMDILIKEAVDIHKKNLKLQPEQIQDKLKPYYLAVEKNNASDVGAITAFNNIQLHIAVGKSISVYSVTFGAAVRIKAFYENTSTECKGLEKHAWRVPWSTKPVFLEDGTLLLISESVQDAGMRFSLEIEAYKFDKSKFALFFSTKKQSSYSLNPVKLTKNKLTITSIDPMKSFFTSNADTHFQRVEVVDFINNKANKTLLVLKDPEIRFVDEWITTARRAVKPTEMQKKAKKLFPEYEMLDNCYVKALSNNRWLVVFSLNDKTAHFTIGKLANAYQVIGVK